MKYSKFWNSGLEISDIGLVRGSSGVIGEKLAKKRLSMF